MVVCLIWVDSWWAIALVLGLIVASFCFAGGVCCAGCFGWF